MICSDCVINGDVLVYSGAVVQPKVSLIADESYSTEIGNNSIVEEMSQIHNSKIGSNCLMGIGSKITMVGTD